MDMSQEDMLNLLEEMEVKNQSLRLNLDGVADAMQEKDRRIQEQSQAIMSLTREITKDYPNFEESEGMDYVEREILEIGKAKKADWAEIVEKVMI